MNLAPLRPCAALKKMGFPESEGARWSVKQVGKGEEGAWGATVRATEYFSGYKGAIVVSARVTPGNPRVQGISYTPGPVYDPLCAHPISPQEAEATARARLEKFGCTSIQVAQKGNLCYYFSNQAAASDKLADGSDPEVVAGRRARLVYVVIASWVENGEALHGSFDIDAETGLILQAGAEDSAPLKSPKKTGTLPASRRAAKVSAQSWSAPVGLAAAAGTALLAAWLIMKKLKPS